MYDESSELLQRFAPTLISPRNPKEEDSVTKSKKFTAAVAASAVASAMVAPAAFAGTTFSDIDGSYAKDAILKLADAGIINGTGAGMFNPAGQIERQDFAIILAKSLKLDTASAPGTATFSDVPKDHYAFAAVEAAVKAGLIKGTGNGQFGAGANLSREDLAALFGRALNYVAGKDIIAGKASKLTFSDAASIADYAKDAVGAAFELGYISGDNGKFDPKGTATREQLASMTTRFLEAADKVVVKDVTAAAKATGVKQITVNFNTAVDTAKAAITVKKGTVAVNVSKVTFSDDKKSAVVDLATKTTKGDYTVSVAGLTTNALTSTVTVENERLDKINFNSDAAAATMTGADITGATVTYSLLNQYGEDITTSNPAITWTASSGTAAGANGVLTFTAPAAHYTKDQKVTVTGVETNSGTVVTKTLNISDAATTDAITFASLYNADDKELNTASTFSDFYVLLDAKDQYGNSISKNNAGATLLNNQFIFSSSNAAVANFGAVTTVADKDGNTKLAIPLAAANGAGLEGTSTLRMINKTTGKTFTFDVSVKKAATVDTISLSNPVDVVAAGETVSIPFTANDQYGKEVTAFSSLNGVVQPTATGVGAQLKFENDYVNKKAVLKYTAPSVKGNYILMVVSPTGKVSQINVEVKDAATPAVVASVVDVKGALASDTESGAKAQTQLSYANFVVQDQYGRNVSLTNTAAFFQNYYLEVAVADGTADRVAVGANAKITNTTDTVDLNAVAKGSERISVTIHKNTDNSVVTGSELEFTEKTVNVSDISEYKIADVSTVYNAATHAVDFDVYGVQADSTKVVLPKELFSVSTTLGGKLSYDADARTLTASLVDADFATGATEKKATANVVVDATSGAVNLSKEVTVTKVDPVVTTIKNKSVTGANAVTVANGVATLSEGTAAANIITNLLATFKYTDQYGVAITPAAPSATVTNLKKATGSTLVVTGNGTNAAAFTGAAKAGDNFTLTIVTSNGKVATLNVVVTN